MTESRRASVDCHYRLDAAGRIVAVSPAWDAVAADYQATRAVSAEVIGQPWRRFVSGAISKHVYELLFTRVRSTGVPIRFAIRCDQPAERRLVQLTIARSEDRGLDVTTQLIEATPREPVALFGTAARHGTSTVVLCSWCCRFQTAPAVWQEPEHAMAVLGLFSGDVMPRLSHGMCNECFVRVNEVVAER